ncbi:MAG TPA: hypothetical protein PLY87_29500, partial [Planctomycetaceae bacterium]|nr:hypothetical protein [Planctomycetaceae bacterium]
FRMNRSQIHLSIARSSSLGEIDCKSRVSTISGGGTSYCGLRSPDWTIESLLEEHEVAHSLDTPREGLDYNESLRVADALENLTVSELKAVLCGIPASWPVSDRELETLGFFLDLRRLPVARRIRQLAATLAG